MTWLCMHYAGGLYLDNLFLFVFLSRKHQHYVTYLFDALWGKKKLTLVQHMKINLKVSRCALEIKITLW